jgi:hypothetical protein
MFERKVQVIRPRNVRWRTSYAPRPVALLTDAAARAALEALRSGDAVKGRSVRSEHLVHLRPATRTFEYLTREGRDGPGERVRPSAGGYQPP